MSCFTNSALDAGDHFRLTQGWFARVYDELITAALSEEARLAIEVRCQERVQGSPSDRECRAMLTKLYFSGSLDPDKTLRSYCDSGKNEHWGGRRPDPPEVCVERYGGWNRG